MGNNASYYSCFSVGIGIPKKGSRTKSKTAMLLDTRGNIREIKVPVKSAELMIQELGHVIAPVEELRRTRRISALPADEELVAGKVYLLVPASRVHSKASEFEMAIAEQWGCEKNGRRKKKSSGNMAKVLPVSSLGQRDGEIEVSSFQGMLVGIPCHQLGIQHRRRWNPVLEPIVESR